MTPRDEGQHTAFALDCHTVRVRDDLNRVDGPARKPIDRIEHLEGPDQIELIDRRHGDDDDPATEPVGGGRHVCTHYRARLNRFASGTSAMSDFGGSLSQNAVPSSHTMPGEDMQEGFMAPRWFTIVGTAVFVIMALPAPGCAQTEVQTTRVEILNLRPTMSDSLPSGRK
jgi:hypothetical protein